MSPPSARQAAYGALLAVYQGAYADVALHRHLQFAMDPRDVALATELVYGSVRRQRTLDALIDQLGKKSARQQPLEIRVLLHLGFYQLRYLDTIPAAVAVNTTVDLAKANGLGRLSGVVNGILRQYLRQGESQDPLVLPADPVAAVGVAHSLPDWIVQLWQRQLPAAEVPQLCDWFNRSPYLDLRINKHKTDVASVQAAFGAAEIPVQPLGNHGLRLLEHAGSILRLPGYGEGYWSVQDASAQQVGLLVDPQPGQVVIDACAAPGGKATHLAELMGDEGTVWACDRTASRLKKVTANAQRLGLSAVKTSLGDSRHRPEFHGTADRVLVDAPCSGLGTLHRHADARWRQSPEALAKLTELQQALLTEAARWLKPEGRLVYATCTLQPAENQGIVQQFLQQHPEWKILPPPAEFAPEREGWVQRWPHRQEMDGFFMAVLGR